MSSQPAVITDPNLSHAWGRALLALAEPGVGGLAPLVVTVPFPGVDEEPREDPVIRAAIDRTLAGRPGAPGVSTSAEMIFPRSLWNPAMPRAALFARYERVRSRVLKDPRNRYGHYFDRMTHFEGAPAAGNQLEFALATYERGNHRKSALQVSILDPRRDQTDQRQRGFPCLQQVAFTPDGDVLEVTAFYATQYHIDRAYGNYLGLCRLGAFVAHELSLRLTRVTCIAAHATLGNFGKAAAAPLVEVVREHLAELAEETPDTGGHVDGEGVRAMPKKGNRIVVARAAAAAGRHA